MIKSTIVCLVTLCLTLTNADIGPAALTKCGQLKEAIIKKVQDVTVNGEQAVCVCVKSSEKIVDAIKDTDLEKNCADKCKPLMDLIKQDEAAIHEEMKAISEQKPFKEWGEMAKSKAEEIKKQDPAKAEAYKTEGKKCEQCGMSNMSAAEKECGKLDADNLVQTVKSACGIA